MCIHRLNFKIPTLFLFCSLNKSHCRSIVRTVIRKLFVSSQFAVEVTVGDFVVVVVVVALHTDRNYCNKEQEG